MGNTPFHKNATIRRVLRVGKDGRKGTRDRYGQAERVVALERFRGFLVERPMRRKNADGEMVEIDATLELDPRHALMATDLIEMENTTDYHFEVFDVEEHQDVLGKVQSRTCLLVKKRTNP